MPNILPALHKEILRLARREIRAETQTFKKHIAEQRRTVAALKREVADLKRNQAFLKTREKRRLEKAPAAEEGDGVRFSPKWVAADRRRLGLSAREYALLVGVSMLTIYNWEQGKSKPQKGPLAAWANVRGIGKREAKRRLELLDG